MVVVDVTEPAKKIKNIVEKKNLTREKKRKITPLIGLLSNVQN